MRWKWCTGIYTSNNSIIAFIFNVNEKCIMYRFFPFHEREQRFFNKLFSVFPLDYDAIYLKKQKQKWFKKKKYDARFVCYNIDEAL